MLTSPLQASAPWFPYPSRFSPSSRYDATFPTAAWYGSSLPSARCDTTIPSLHDPACDIRFNTYSTLVICHPCAGRSPAYGAAPAHVARSITRANEPGFEEENGAQVPRAQFFTSKFRRRFSLNLRKDVDHSPMKGRGSRAAPKILLC